jgi:hypothetical protein
VKAAGIWPESPPEDDQQQQDRHDADLGDQEGDTELHRGMDRIPGQNSDQHDDARHQDPPGDVDPEIGLQRVADEAAK